MFESFKMSILFISAKCHDTENAKTECRLFSTKLEYDDLMVIDVDSNEHNINDVINKRKRKLLYEKWKYCDIHCYDIFLC